MTTRKPGRLTGYLTPKHQKLTSDDNSKMKASDSESLDPERPDAVTPTNGPLVILAAPARGRRGCLRIASRISSRPPSPRRSKLLRLPSPQSCGRDAGRGFESCRRQQLTGVDLDFPRDVRAGCCAWKADIGFHPKLHHLRLGRSAARLLKRAGCTTSGSSLHRFAASALAHRPRQEPRGSRRNKRSKRGSATAMIPRKGRRAPHLPALSRRSAQIERDGLRRSVVAVRRLVGATTPKRAIASRSASATCWSMSFKIRTACNMSC